MRRRLATTLGWLMLSLAPGPGTTAHAAAGYPAPAPSTLDAMRQQHRTKDWLRVTTDSTRFVTRVRVLNEYGLVGLSIGERSREQPSQVPWSSIRRIEVQTNHSTLLKFAAAVVGSAILLSQGASSTDNSAALAIAGGGLLAGAVGSLMLHERLLYAAPGSAP